MLGSDFLTHVSACSWLLWRIDRARAQTHEPHIERDRVRQLDLHMSLGWHGVLRDEPATLQWGITYELTSVGINSAEPQTPQDQQSTQQQ